VGVVLERIGGVTTISPIETAENTKTANSRLVEHVQKKLKEQVVTAQRWPKETKKTRDRNEWMYLFCLHKI